MMPSEGTAPGAPNLRTVIAKAIHQSAATWTVWTGSSMTVHGNPQTWDAIECDVAADAVLAAIAAAGMVIGRPVTYESLTNDDFNQLDEFGVLDGDPETFTGMLEAFAACGLAVLRVAGDV